jgi:hypothetical protein
MCSIGGPVLDWLLVALLLIALGPIWWMDHVFRLLFCMHVVQRRVWLLLDARLMRCMYKPCGMTAVFCCSAVMSKGMAASALACMDPTATLVCRWFATWRPAGAWGLNWIPSAVEIVLYAHAAHVDLNQHAITSHCLPCVTTRRGHWPLATSTVNISETVVPAHGMLPTPQPLIVSDWGVHAQCAIVSCNPLMQPQPLLLLTRLMPAVRDCLQSATACNKQLASMPTEPLDMPAKQERLHFDNHRASTTWLPTASCSAHLSPQPNVTGPLFRTTHPRSPT